MQNKRMKQYMDLLISEKTILLNFLKAKYPLFHNSNIFFRDFQYGIRRFLEKKGIHISYSDAEFLANELSGFFMKENIFIKVNSLGWRLNYPEFTAQPAAAN